VGAPGGGPVWRLRAKTDLALSGGLTASIQTQTAARRDMGAAGGSQGSASVEFSVSSFEVQFGRWRGLAFGEAGAVRRAGNRARTRTVLSWFYFYFTLLCLYV